MARLLVADAAVRAHDGDLNAALDSAAPCSVQRGRIGDDPFLLSQAVRVGIGRIALRSAPRALAQGEPSDAALARLQALVLNEQDQPLLLHCLKGERALMTELIRRIAVGDVAVMRLSDGAALPGAAFAPLSVEMCQSFAHSPAMASSLVELTPAARFRPGANSSSNDQTGRSSWSG